MSHGAMMKHCGWAVGLLVAGLTATGAARGQDVRPAVATRPGHIRSPSDTAPPWATAVAPLALRGVTVIDVARGRHLADETVVIVGNRIRTMGPTIKVKLPRGARVIDGRGKYLIPGLWDMHFHQYAAVFFNGQPRDSLLAHGLDSMSLYGLDSAISHPLLIANGITGIRDPGAFIPLARLGQWKRAIAAGAHVGPRMLVAGPLVDEGYDGARGDGRSVGASTPERMRRLVDSLQAAGADFIKTYFLSPQMYFVLAAEARRIGIPFGGHGTTDKDGQWDVDGTEVGGLALSDSGAGILDHATWLRGDACGDTDVDSLKVEQCAAAGEHFRRNNTWIVAGPGPLNGRAGLDFPRRWYELRRRYVPAPFETDSERAQQLAWYRKKPNWARGYPTSSADWIVAGHWADSASGRIDPVTGAFHWDMLRYVPILAGTDIALGAGVPGFTLHDMLAIYVAKGMSPLAALQSATLNPALAWRATDSLGTVEAGKLADLVLLDADPLQDIWNTTKIRAVVANGRYFDRAALDQLLARAERTAHR